MEDERVQAIHKKARDGVPDRLENSDCINAYAQMLQTGRGDVILVTEDSNLPLQKWKGVTETSPVFWYYIYDAYFTTAILRNSTETYGWMRSAFDNQRRACSETIGQIKASPQTWTVGGACRANSPVFNVICEWTIQMRGPIKYCLSEKTEPRCKIQWSIPIAALVTVLNLLKACLMFYTAFYIDEEPLMTMGDAVASFLNNEDPSTVNRCILSSKDLDNTKGRRNGHRAGHTMGQTKPSFPPAGPRQWIGRRYRWRHATSKAR